MSPLVKPALVVVKTEERTGKRSPRVPLAAQVHNAQLSAAAARKPPRREQYLEAFKH